MKKEQFFAMTEKERNDFLRAAAAQRKSRLENPEMVKLAKTAAEKLQAGKQINVFEFEALTGIAFSHSMGDKMQGILALSTNCLFNKRCIERMLSGDSVCSKCYAAALELFRSGTLENTSYNTIILNDHVLELTILPDLSGYDELRIEAFGDSGSWTAAANYMNIARVNPGVNVTAWTKNPDHYLQAIKKGFSKPDNFTLIYSSPRLNEPAKIAPRYMEIIDHVFTVYTWKYIVKNNIPESFINCGGRHCKTCQRCYKNGKRGAFFINELLKSDKDKAEKAGWTFGTVTENQDKTNYDFSAFRVEI